MNTETNAVSQHIPANFTTHRSAWRKAIELAIKNAPVSSAPDEDEKGYWEHELAAFDRAFTRLLDEPEAVSHELSNDKCDEIAAKALDRVAAASGMHGLEINSDILTNAELRRELVRSGAANTGHRALLTEYSQTAPADWRELAMLAWDAHAANLKLEHNTYQNQNFFFDGFKAAAGIPLLSEDALQLVREARAEGKAAADNSDALRRLRAAFHVNMLRAYPDKTHEEIAAEIARAIGAQESESMDDRPTWADVQARERDIRALQSTVIELRQALASKGGAQPVVLKTSELMRTLSEARTLALQNAGEVPTSKRGDFNAIAQNLYWALSEIQRATPDDSNDSSGPDSEPPK